MKCFRCEKGKMATKVTDVAATVRGDSFTVKVEALVCPRCGDLTMTEKQALAYSVVSADAYRKAHGLLTTAEIKEAREHLGLTQTQFAERLSVGIASVKRWEAGAIQDESSDKLIRICTDLDYARANVNQIEMLLRVRKISLDKIHTMPSAWKSTQLVESRRTESRNSPKTGRNATSSRRTSDISSYAA